MTAPRAGLSLPGWIALSGGLIAGIGFIIVVAAAYVSRNPDYSCLFVEVDFAQLGIDVEVPGGITGTWGWWPVGLTCTFPAVGGGFVEVAPEPSLSVVFVGSIVSAAVGAGGLVALAINGIR